MNLAIPGIEPKNIKNDDCLDGRPYTNPMLGIWVQMNIIKEGLIFMSFWGEHDEGSNCNR